MKIALFNIISSDDAICKHIVAVISNGFPVYPIYFAHRTLFPVIIIIMYVLPSSAIFVILPLIKIISPIRMITRRSFVILHYIKTVLAFSWGKNGFLFI